MASLEKRLNDFDSEFGGDFSDLGISFAKPSGVLIFCIFTSVCLACFFSAFFFKSEFFLLFVLLSIFLPFLFIQLLEFKRELAVKELESFLPSALFQIASFPKKTSFEKMVDKISTSNYGKLSEEFSKIKSLVCRGASIPDALVSASKSTKSRIFSRALNLLSDAYRSGGDYSRALKGIAESIFSLNALKKEAESSSAMLKYTLMLGGCVLMPLSLGLLINISSSFQFSSDPAVLEQVKSLSSNVISSGYLYLAVLSFLISGFVSMQENNVKKAAIYFAVLAPLSAAVFTFAKMMAIA